MDSARGHPVSPGWGCPIRTSSDHRLPAAPRGLSRPGHVLLRLQMPRHPPCALRANPPGVSGSTEPAHHSVFTHVRCDTPTHSLRFHHRRHPCRPVMRVPRPQAPSVPTRIVAHPSARRRPASATQHMRVPLRFLPTRLRVISLVKVTGGAAGTRTPDLRLAKAALSRLSYSPVVLAAGGRSWT